MLTYLSLSVKKVICLRLKLANLDYAEFVRLNFFALSHHLRRHHRVAFPTKILLMESYNGQKR